MKSIEQFVAYLNGNDSDERVFTYKKITFRHAASGNKCKRKGYAIYWKQPNLTHPTEFLTFEPKWYSNGDRWMAYGFWLQYRATYEDNRLHVYAKNIRAAIKKVKQRTNI